MENGTPAPILWELLFEYRQNRTENIAVLQISLDLFDFQDNSISLNFTSGSTHSGSDQESSWQQGEDIKTAEQMTRNFPRVP